MKRIDKHIALEDDGSGDGNGSEKEAEKDKEISSTTTDIKEYYTKEEAKEAIDNILEKYNDASDDNKIVCEIIFADDNAMITNSYLVSSKEDRETISKIITKTENLTDRSYENLLAEWKAHNVAYNLGFFRSSSKDVNLDYTQDRRWYVRWATNIFEFMRWY